MIRSTLLFLFHQGQQEAFKLDLPTSADISVEIFNLLGQKVHAEEFFGLTAGPSRSLTLAVPNLPSGVYVYRIVARMETSIHLVKGQMTLVK